MHAKRIPLAIALVAALAAIPTATATPLDVLHSPTWDEVTYDDASNTVTLSWQPPGNDITIPYTYHVYRNGDLVASTTDTQYQGAVAGPYNLYAVAAVDEDGDESLPTEPVLVQSQSSGGFNHAALFPSQPPIHADGPCDLVGFSIEKEFPYVYWGIHWECLGSAGRAMGNGMFPIHAETFLG